MGNSTSQDNAQSQILNKFWQPISTSLYRNKLTHQVIKRKKITFRTQQQMKYVFNCLLKRMNNSNSYITKIIFLKKQSESDSLCNCGHRYSILVFVQHLQFTLTQFIKQKRKSINFNSHYPSNIYESKCVCLQILKGLQFLKQKYGTFRVSINNVWIQQNLIQASNQDNQNKIYTPYNKNSTQNIKIKYKAKVWISQLEEQNYPDQSCQQKQMCISVINLFKGVLIPNKLCKCYNSTEIFNISGSKLKNLIQSIQKDHEQKDLTINSAYSQNKQHQTVKNQNIKLPLDRQFRSSSMHQPTINHYKVYNPIQRNLYQINDKEIHRKYSSIQYVRKPKQKQYLNMTQKIHSKTNYITPPQPYAVHTLQNTRINQSGPQISKSNKYQMNYNVKQNKVNYNIPIKQNHQDLKDRLNNIIQNQIHSHQPQRKIQNVSYKFDPNFQPEILNKSNLHPIRGHFFNPKIKFRNNNQNFVFNQHQHKSSNNSSENHIPHDNNQKNSQKSFQNTKVNFNNHELSFTSKNQSVLKNHFKNNQSLSERPQVQSSAFKKYHQKSYDNITDRIKISTSFKEQDKKEIQAINTSRKNISITPISLDSTYGATSSLKPLVIPSVSKNQQVQNNNKEDNFKILDEDLSNESPQKTQARRQSNSSSKSEQGHYTNHQVTNSKQQFNVKKRLSNQISPCSKEIQQTSQQNKSKKSHYFLKPSESGNKLVQNNQLIRLRQSEYIISGKNSFIKSKQQSKINSKENSKLNSNQNSIHLQTISKDITSLAQMQSKFKTKLYIDGDNYNFVSQQMLDDIQIVSSTEKIRKQGDISIKQISDQKNNKIDNQYKNQTKIKNLISENTDFAKENYEQNRLSAYQIQWLQNKQKIPYEKASSHLIFQTDKNQNQIDVVKVSSQENVSSLVMRQPEQPLSVVNQEQYVVRIANTSFQNQNVGKIHQKKLSSPTFDKAKLAKNKSLKDQFSKFLKLPKQNSFKALTQNKSKILHLEQNQGRQTYSIYNESEYNNSQKTSKKGSQIEVSFQNIPVPPNIENQTSKRKKVKLPLSKNQIEKEMTKIKDSIKKQAQQLLRLTSSGHQDNSIKQKVRNKKAQFAQLKNQMNSLLL